jgi:hypothetical protein
MHLNLPILDALKDCQRVLIAGAGGGFDVYAGLPIYFTLRDHGKTVHLANYSFTDPGIARVIDNAEMLIDPLLIRPRGEIRYPFPYYPEGYLTRWFQEARGEDVPVYMFTRTGVKPLSMAYTYLIQHLGGIDALILIDGGVDSIMRGDESGAGTLLEDSISLAAADALEVPVKLLACLGFGTEVEEAVCHYHALENIAALAAAGAFYGSCALTPQMEAFRLYEAACRYCWEQPNHHKSHISTRIIPAVNGQFGDVLYPDDRAVPVLISPLMSLYWFFDLPAVVKRNRLIEWIRPALTQDDAMQIALAERPRWDIRPPRSLPY